jgi:ribosomal 50S subunit-associated protein YjgA (DUF615 family)
MYISEIGNQKLEKILEKMIKKGKIKTIIIKDEIYYYALEYDSAIQTFLQDHPSATVEELEDFMKKLQKEQGEEVI